MNLKNKPKTEENLKAKVISPQKPSPVKAKQPVLQQDKNTQKQEKPVPPVKTVKLREMPSEFFDEFYHALPLAKKFDAKKCLSLDIDIDKVRYLLVRKSGDFLQVLQWGVQKFPTEEKNLLKALQIALENIRAKVYKPGMEIYASIFSPEFNIRQIIMPKMSKSSDLEKAIFYKNQSDLQTFDEHSVWSYKILDEFDESATKKLRILITVIPSKTVNRYLEVFENSKLVLTSLIPRQAAILGAYRKMAHESKKDLLIDISYDHSQICFLKNGQLEYIRNLGIGARNLEIMIRDGDKKSDSPGINLSGQSGNVTLPAENVNELRSRLLERVKDLQEKQNPVLQTFFSEILRSMAFIQGKGNEEFIERILITGYGIRKESLIPYLRNRLKIPILVVAPRFYPEKTRSFDFGEFFSTMGTFLQKGKPFNILPKHYQNRIVFRKLNWLIFIIIIFAGMGLAYYSFLQNQILANKRSLISQYHTEYEKLNPVEGMYKELVNQISMVNDQNKELKSYVDAQPPMLEVLRLFSNETPGEIIFKRLHFHQAESDNKSKKQISESSTQYWVDVEGVIKSDILVGDVILINFINKLNEIGYFKSIQLNHTQKKPEENITMFGIRAML